jgi:Zn finger protein HypA/HybF involved in hydrogenase expression
MKFRCGDCAHQFEAEVSCPSCHGNHTEVAEPVQLGEEGRRIIQQLFSEETEEES